jgi:hypothetical protein
MAATGCASTTQGISVLYALATASGRGVGDMAAPQADPGALSIAPPDGYQYGDDHPWTPDDQSDLVKELGKLKRSLTATPEAD